MKLRDYVKLSGSGDLEPFIHPAATVEGLVELGEGCSIWPGAVLRADLNTMRLGRFVNIQDNTTLHVDSRSPIEIGDYTLVGHNAMLHGCRVGRACMIGIGSIVLDQAQIGDGAMITAGCLIRGGKRIPPRALVVQKDGRLQIVENGAKLAYTVAGSLEYMELARRYREGVVRPFTREEEQELSERAREIIAELGI
jgi:carbonic anhydrase/acetyltransferase-like protein (isoleucine patch superfamily)